MSPTHEMEEYLLEEVVNYMKLVEKEILANLNTDPSTLGDIASHLIRAGGKRVRPALVLLSYRAAGGNNIEEVIPIAAAIELIHSASLIHDDINDASKTRRGVPTTNIKFGNSNALVAGDFLFVKAFRIGGKYDWEIVRIIADACAMLAEGEIQQDHNRYNTDITVPEYLETINKKTASLIMACARVGAVLSGCPEEMVEALTEYARNIGMTFQITDDILDIKGTEKSTGKSTGNDIREGQLSIVLINALQELEGEKKSELAAIIEKKENSEEEVQRALELIGETNTLKRAYELANEFSELARGNLMKLEETDFRDNLELIIEMIVQRFY